MKHHGEWCFCSFIKEHRLIDVFYSGMYISACQAAQVILVCQTSLLPALVLVQDLFAETCELINSSKIPSVSEWLLTAQRCSKLVLYPIKRGRRWKSAPVTCQGVLSRPCCCSASWSTQASVGVPIDLLLLRRIPTCVIVEHRSPREEPCLWVWGTKRCQCFWICSPSTDGWRLKWRNRTNAATLMWWICAKEHWSCPQHTVFTISHQSVYCCCGIIHF